MAVAVHPETKWQQPKLTWLEADGSAGTADWVLPNRIRVKRWRVYADTDDVAMNAYCGLLLEAGGVWLTLWQYNFQLATVAQPKLAYTETWSECNMILEQGTTIEAFGQATAAGNLTYFVLIEYEDVV